MKIIKSKLEFHPVTLVFLLLCFLSGSFKPALFILIIVIVHESGHILLLKKYHYPIRKIMIYPFGGITIVEKPLNTPLKKEFFIAIAGILFQVILEFIFFMLYREQIINFLSYDLFSKYNKAILLFNLLPIIPLDGSILFNTICETFFSYRISYYLKCVTSVLFLFFFWQINEFFSFNNYMIISFLIFKTYEAFRRYPYYKERFLLERHLNDLEYTKIKNERNLDLRLLKKDAFHYFYNGKTYVSEKKLLSQLFDNQHHFW